MEAGLRHLEYRHALVPVGDSAAPVDRFFVLSHAELAGIQVRRNHPDEDVSYDESSGEARMVSITSRFESVKGHEDLWDKIVEWCSRPAARD